MNKISINIKKLLTFGIDNDLEIISFGLAPNPNGFCFESHGKASETIKNHFSKELDALSVDEISELKKLVFV